MALWHKARALTLRDWGVIAEAWFTLAWVKIALKVDRTKTVARAMRVSGGTGDDLACVARLFTMAAGHHVTETNCLPRAVALQRMALRRGAQPLLRIGVRNASPTRVGHAWLELNGVPFNERADIAQLFTVLDRRESAGRAARVDG